MYINFKGLSLKFIFIKLSNKLKYMILIGKKNVKDVYFDENKS